LSSGDNACPNMWSTKNFGIRLSFIQIVAKEALSACGLFGLYLFIAPFFASPIKFINILG